MENVSLYDIVPYVQELDLDSSAGFQLPGSIDEQAILDWINQRRDLLQYNDDMILDTREDEDVQFASPLGPPLDYIPLVYNMTWNLFDTFCNYFGISPDLKAQLNCVDSKQSVVLVKDIHTNAFSILPYFKNVNYSHHEVQPSMNLRALMEMQQQALILNQPIYPYYHDDNNYQTLLESHAETSSQKRKWDTVAVEFEYEDLDDDDSDQMEMDSDDQGHSHKMQCTEEEREKQQQAPSVLYYMLSDEANYKLQ